MELRTEELATIALSLTGTELNGRGMKIGRPNGYVPPAGDNASQASVCVGKESALQGGAHEYREGGSTRCMLATTPHKQGTAGACSGGYRVAATAVCGQQGPTACSALTKCCLLCCAVLCPHLMLSAVLCCACEQVKLQQAAALAAKLGGGVTNVVLLEGMVDAATIRDESERREVSQKAGWIEERGHAHFCLYGAICSCVAWAAAVI